ncbi:MAG: pyridoxal phosphate-dependent transferase [Benjaminiella poitrasii]|nr:MAG: pyridoxal phosphate-dependent transferase [Benjaminiella poitrasii]
MNFNKGLREEFYFEPKFVPLNHGALGVYPKIVGEALNTYRLKAEANPDRWIRFDMYQALERNLQLLGNYIHCNPIDLAFVQNSTQAANTILRSYPFKAGDKILYYRTGYIAVNKTLEFIRDQYKVELISIELNYPVEDANVIQLTKETIEREHAKHNEPKIVMAVIDAISSAPGVRFPFEALTKLVREYDILSFVDGAHAIGHIELNIDELDPDFFFSNCHKWLYTPRGCTVLYVSKRNQGFIHPTAINSAYKYHEDRSDASSFGQEFIPPIIDISNYLCVEPALRYREEIGEDAIRAYSHDIAVKGGQLVADILGTHVMENSTKTLTINMVNVRLPAFKTTKSDAEVVAFYYKKLIFEHNTTASVYKHNHNWWIRLSGQIYVDLDDFKHMAQALVILTKELNEEN